MENESSDITFFLKLSLTRKAEGLFLLYPQPHWLSLFLHVGLNYLHIALRASSLVRRGNSFIFLSPLLAWSWWSQVTVIGKKPGQVGCRAEKWFSCEYTQAGKLGTVVASGWDTEGASKRQVEEMPSEARFYCLACIYSKLCHPLLWVDQSPQVLFLSDALYTHDSRVPLPSSLTASTTQPLCFHHAELEQT